MNREGIFISQNESIKAALKKLDKSIEKVLLVVDAETKLLGTITDGDVRRYILKGHSLDKDIAGLYNRNPLYIKKEDFSAERSKRTLIENGITLLPVVDKNGMVIDYVTHSNYSAGSEKMPPRSGRIDIPVVIMAGGEGTRLEPFSKIFPKALIPVGDKPIIELIVDEFRQQGADKYYIILNHKGDMIESYFNSIDRDYTVKYVWEEDFLGTAGSLKLLEDNIAQTFIVSNCDIIVKANFEDVLNFHREHKASFTGLSSIQYYKIPYGVVKFKEGGDIIDILEKPEYTFTINTGLYVLERDILKLIPEKTRFDMTDVIRALIKNGRKVLTYPVNESDYMDIGQCDEYKKVVDKLQLLK
jgi:dTDP-glucose pyrophosphorylase